MSKLFGLPDGRMVKFNDESYTPEAMEAWARENYPEAYEQAPMPMQHQFMPPPPPEEKGWMDAANAARTGMAASFGSTVKGLGAVLDWAGADSLGETLKDIGGVAEDYHLQQQEKYIDPTMNFGEGIFQRREGDTFLEGVGRTVRGGIQESGPMLGFMTETLATGGAFKALSTATKLKDLPKVARAAAWLESKPIWVQNLGRGVPIALTQRAAEGMMEGAGAYDAAIAAGMTPEEADLVAAKTTAWNIPLAVIDIGQFGMMLNALPKPVAAQLTNVGRSYLAKIPLSVLQTGLAAVSEGQEEALQQEITNWALGEGFDPKVVWNPMYAREKHPESWNIGALTGFGMQGGVGALDKALDIAVDKLTPEEQQELIEEQHRNMSKEDLERLSTTAADLAALQPIRQKYPKINELNPEAPGARPAEIQNPLPADHPMMRQPIQEIVQIADQKIGEDPEHDSIVAVRQRWAEVEELNKQQMEEEAAYQAPETQSDNTFEEVESDTESPLMMDRVRQVFRFANNVKPTRDGAVVEKDGHRTIVKLVNMLHPTQEALQSWNINGGLREYYRRITDPNDTLLGQVGAHTTANGDTVIYLAQGAKPGGQAKLGTLKHEVFHEAMLNMLSPKERSAVLRKYFAEAKRRAIETASTSDASDIKRIRFEKIVDNPNHPLIQQAEELAAEAYAAHTGPKTGVLAKIKKFIDTLRNIPPVERPEDQQIFDRLRSGDMTYNEFAAVAEQGMRAQIVDWNGDPIETETTLEEGESDTDFDDEGFPTGDVTMPDRPDADIPSGYQPTPPVVPSVEGPGFQGWAEIRQKIENNQPVTPEDLDAVEQEWMAYAEAEEARDKAERQAARPQLSAKGRAARDAAARELGTAPTETQKRTARKAAEKAKKEAVQRDNALTKAFKTIEENLSPKQAEMWSAAKAGDIIIGNPLERDRNEQEGRAAMPEGRETIYDAPFPVVALNAIWNSSREQAKDEGYNPDDALAGEPGGVVGGITDKMYNAIMDLAAQDKLTEAEEEPISEEEQAKIDAEKKAAAQAKQSSRQFFAENQTPAQPPEPQLTEQEKASEQKAKEQEEKRAKELAPETDNVAQGYPAVKEFTPMDPTMMESIIGNVTEPIGKHRPVSSFSNSPVHSAAMVKSAFPAVDQIQPTEQGAILRFGDKHLIIELVDKFPKGGRALVKPNEDGTLVLFLAKNSGGLTAATQRSMYQAAMKIMLDVGLPKKQRNALEKEVGELTPARVRNLANAYGDFLFYGKLPSSPQLAKVFKGLRSGNYGQFGPKEKTKAQIQNREATRLLRNMQELYAMRLPAILDEDRGPSLEKAPEADLTRVDKFLSMMDEYLRDPDNFDEMQDWNNSQTRLVNSWDQSEADEAYAKKLLKGAQAVIPTENGVIGVASSPARITILEFQLVDAIPANAEALSFHGTTVAEVMENVAKGEMEGPLGAFSFSPEDSTHYADTYNKEVRAYRVRIARSWAPENVQQGSGLVAGHELFHFFAATQLTEEELTALINPWLPFVAKGMSPNITDAYLESIDTENAEQMEELEKKLWREGILHKATAAAEEYVATAFSAWMNTDPDIWSDHAQEIFSNTFNRPWKAQIQIDTADTVKIFERVKKWAEDAPRLFGQDPPDRNHEFHAKSFTGHPEHVQGYIEELRVKAEYNPLFVGEAENLAQKDGLGFQADTAADQARFEHYRFNRHYKRLADTAKAISQFTPSNPMNLDIDALSKAIEVAEKTAVNAQDRISKAAVLYDRADKKTTMRDPSTPIPKAQIRWAPNGGASTLDLLGDWFRGRDRANYLAHAESLRLSDMLKEAAYEIDKKKSTNLFGQPAYMDFVRQLDESIHLYVDMQRDPSAYDRYVEAMEERGGIPEDKAKMIEMANEVRNNPRLLAIAEIIRDSYRGVGKEAVDNGVLFNLLEHYVNRAWKARGGVASEKFGFDIESSHRLHRTLPTILDGWALGMELKTKGAIGNLALYRESIGATTENRRLIEKGMDTRIARDDPKSPPLLTTAPPTGYGYVAINHPGFTVWEKTKVVKGDIPGGRKQYMFSGDVMYKRLYAVRDALGTIVETFESEDKAKEFAAKGTEYSEPELVTERWERQKIYAEPKLAKRIEKVIQPGWDQNWFKVMLKANSLIKSTILMTSFFHHQAFLRSFWLGTHGMAWEWDEEQGKMTQTLGKARAIRAYKEGLMAMKMQDPTVGLLADNGLTIGRMQDFDEVAADDALEWMTQKLPVGKAAARWFASMRQRQATYLFKRFGAGLKIQAALIEYHNNLKKFGDTKTPEEIAEMTANLINADFGGLHWERMGISRKAQEGWRMLLLAPDWTGSNLLTVKKSFYAGEGFFNMDKGTAEDRAMYRRFWMGVLAKGLALSAIFNIGMAALAASLGDDDREYGLKAMGLQLKDDWKRFLWADVDVTPIYNLVMPEKINDGRRRYFSILGHFKDPLKWAMNPGKAIIHKGAPLISGAMEFATGKDWKGDPFTSLDEFLGIDSKGFYKTDGPGHRAGDPKGGKFARKLTKRYTEYGMDEGNVGISQYPSFIASQLVGFLPVQAQEFIGLVMGERDAFDAITRSIGFHEHASRGDDFDILGREIQEESLKLKELKLKDHRQYQIRLGRDPKVAQRINDYEKTNKYLRRLNQQKLSRDWMLENNRISEQEHERWTERADERIRKYRNDFLRRWK